MSSPKSIGTRSDFVIDLPGPPEIPANGEDWRIAATVNEIEHLKETFAKYPDEKLLELELVSLQNRLLKLQRQAVS
jgi:hypothetical protein